MRTFLPFLAGALRGGAVGEGVADAARGSGSGSRGAGAAARCARRVAASRSPAVKAGGVSAKRFARARASRTAWTQRSRSSREFA